MHDPLAIVADERPKPPVVSPVRVSISETMPTVVPAGEDPWVSHYAAGQTLLARVAATLDQIVNRSRDEARKYGAPLSPDSLVHAGDFSECERLARTLEAAAACARKMIAGVRDQFPKPAPAPKGHKR